jgi:Rrf2 family nitric oxide-sensitive transcriptional repressor
MRLTSYTDYSLRILIYLGLCGPEELSTIEQISGAYGISANHLMKVVNRLGKLGYVETVRGRGGGLRLGLPPVEINIGQVVRQMEPDLAMVECFDREKGRCAIKPACRLKSVLEKALDGFLDVLDDYTLADLLINPAPLRELVHLAATPL